MSNSVLSAGGLKHSDTNGSDLMEHIVFQQLVVAAQVILKIRDKTA